LCVHGDQQIEGVDYFKTYAPVVQWSTIRTMLILSVAMKWKSKQVDYELAFLHAGLEDYVYVDIEDSSSQEESLEAVEVIYYIVWIEAESKNFFEHLKVKFFSQDYRQSTNGPSLLILFEAILSVLFMWMIVSSLLKTYEVIDEAVQQLLIHN